MENFSPAANRKLVASGLVMVEDKDARGHDLCDYRDGEQHHKQSPGKIKCGKITLLAITTAKMVNHECF